MIYIFLADGFEEIEALTVADILRRAEKEVALVGVGSKIIRGSHGITVACDLEQSETTLNDLEMVVLPGGMPGTLNLEKSEVVRSFVAHAVQNDIWVGAICAAPTILGHMGLLDGVRVTCYPGFEDQLGGAKFLDTSTVRDGKIITASGAGQSIKFGLALLEALEGKARADLLAASLQC